MSKREMAMPRKRAYRNVSIEMRHAFAFTNPTMGKEV